MPRSRAPQHAVEPAPQGSRATLSLRLEGLFSGPFGRLTGSITERYMGLEAAGLKARSENPTFRINPEVAR